MEKPSEMKTNQISPKQGLALGVLVLVLLSVGVWQWQSMSGRRNPSRPASASTSNSNTGVSATVSTSRVALASAPLAPLPVRDPFRPAFSLSEPSGRVASPATRSPGQPLRRTITGTPPVPPIGLPAPGGLEIKRADEPAPIPDWTLVGVVQGPRTIAILKDSEGHRRFVQIGDLLEEGWRVRRIERGVITVQKGKQMIAIQVGTSTQPDSQFTGGTQR